MMNEERIQKLKDYFNQFDSFEQYEKTFPHHIFRLEKIYEENEKGNEHYMSKKKYVKKHMRDAFQGFQNIILKTPEEINTYYLIKLFYSLSDEHKKKIKQVVLEDKLFVKLNSPLDKKFVLKIISNAILIGGTNLISTLIPSTVIASAVPVFGWVTGGVGILSTVVYAFKDELGLWRKNNSKKDISRCLFEWFIMKKDELLTLYIDSFDDLIQKAFEELKSQKDFDERSCKLRKLIEKLEQRLDFRMEYELNSEYPIYNLVEDTDLQTFVKEAYLPKQNNNENQGHNRI